MKQAARIAGRRALPAVGRVLEHPTAAAALRDVPRMLLVEAIRSEMDEARAAAARGVPAPDAGAIASRAAERARHAARPSLRRAINATGVILHTGLGRAVLPEAARLAVAEAVAGHCALEVDEETGQRGTRQAHLAPLLTSLTGAEAALVVNNNAGAVLLCIAALAAGGEVVISRGELVEIGGAFRMPDIVRAGGAALVEVGTTNRTRLSDFEAAITDRTALLLRCHPSNFRVVGFTQEVPAADLARLGQERGIPVLDDLGSGALVGTALFGAGPSATLRDAVGAGSDLVTASGDKLLGGPQAGLIVGRSELVGRMARHPLARALRVDKVTVAALEATLRLYIDPERARTEVPALRFLARSREVLADMAAQMAARIASLSPGALVDLVDQCSQVGGGSLPGEDLPTVCVRVRSEAVPADALAARLRVGEPAVYGRVRDDALLLDPRAIEAEELAEAAEAVSRALQAPGRPEAGA